MAEQSQKSPWLPHREPNPAARLRLFCFPHAGGGVAPFHAWASKLPAEVDVCPIKIPGREERLRETPLDNMPSLIEALTEGISSRLDLPFALLGHSMGALVAFELAGRLRRERGITPECLFVAACPAPDTRYYKPHVYALSDDEFIEKLQERYEGMEEVRSMSPAYVKLFLPAMKADMKLVETYEYRETPPLDCQIAAMTASEDGDVNPADVAAWEKHTTGRFTLRNFPGNHFFLRKPSGSVMKTIRKQLEAILDGVAKTSQQGACSSR